MEPMLTQEENEIIEYIESNQAKSIDNLESEKNRFQKMAASYGAKKKAVNIRLPETDIYLLKQKALENGLSYQNIIQSLVHQYTHGKISTSL
jgi:predicted DNA binding CopG/RHH family protein